MFQFMHLKETVSAAAIFAGLSMPVCAADTSCVNAAAMAGGQGGAVAQLSMAQALYSYGVANKDALSVLAAARIAGSIAPEDMTREVETMPTEGVDITEEGEGVDGPVDAAAMLAMAMELAGGDPASPG
ncbi:MAG: hypothetical protein ACI8R4_003874 [Paracoccaceae bacterium]|jgi:hypothetical protein